MLQEKIILGQALINSATDIFVIAFACMGMFLAGWWFARRHASNDRAVNNSPQHNTTTENSLLKEVNLLRDIVNQSPAIIYVKDTQLRYIFANAKFAEFFNLQPEGIYGTTDDKADCLDKAIFADVETRLKEFEDDDRRVLAGEVIQEFSNPYEFNGKICYFDTTKIPMRDEAGEIIGILNVAQDITEQKRLQDIQKYDHKLQDVVTNLATEFINLQADEFDTSVNHMLEKIGEFIGAGRTYIYHFSDDLDLASMVYEWVSSDTNTQIETQQNVSTQPFAITFEKFKRGEEEFIGNVLELPAHRQVEKDRLLERGIYARITLPLFRDGKLFGSMGFHATKPESDWADYSVDLLKIVAEIYINLMSRKDINQKITYQANLLENVSDAVISTDLNSIINTWNHGAENLYGYREEEVIGKNFSELLETEYINQSQNTVIQEFIANERWQGEIIRYDRDGTPLNILASVSIIKDSAGNNIGAVSINHDISEQKRLEKQQTELTIQNERIQLLEDVISDLSHDIKTPLATIQTSLYLLSKASTSEKREYYLQRMRANVKHLTRLVEDILTMTRLDKGKELEFTPVNLNILVENISNTYDDLLETKDNKLSFNLTPDLNPVLGNEAELSRVISNLIENAIHYTPSGKSIVVSTYSEDFHNIFEVQDFGIGIDEMDLPHIFKRFYRADKARDTSKGGTGLGLAIVKKLVELHNGTITVESFTNQGSKFIVKLPVSQV